MSPREYQTRVDMCEVWSLMQQGYGTCDIATMMGKDPARISRLMGRVQEDFHTLFPKPSEDDAIAEHLARLEMMIRKAQQIAEQETGMARVSALRAASAILRDKGEFLKFTGRISRNADDPNFSPLLKRAMMNCGLPPRPIAQPLK